MKKLLMIFFSLIMMMIVLPEIKVEASDWKHYTRGVELFNQGKYIEAAKELELAASISEKASTLRKLAQTYEKSGQYQKAADTYFREANVHKLQGATNTYLAVVNLANALNTEIELFFESGQSSATSRTLGKYEPSSGMYIGAYIEQDDIRSKPGNKYRNFNDVTEKDHAIFFTYHRYGNGFPTNFAKQAKEVGAAIHISMQPESGLSEVVDDDYLRKFASDAKASGVPIFLRFASEMNGDWVTWHGNPTLYKEKFELVSKVMKAEAPNVAMAWVPNSVPVHNIDDYYPGDQWVDWVGVNLYSVPFFNGDVNAPADHVNPLDLLDPIYQMYADRKPIMIGEYGASHFSSVGNQDVSKFGTTKMNMFYHGMKMKYPRVKAAHWFSVDTLTAPYVAENRRLNNFSITSSRHFLGAYQSVIKDKYFLSNVENGPFVKENSLTAPVVQSLENSTVSGDITGIAFAKTYDPYISKVVYQLNGKYLAEGNQYPFRYQINQSQLKQGENQLTAVVFDSKNKEAQRKTITFQHREAINLKDNEIKIFINERTVYSGKGQNELLAAPYVKSGRTLVPLRFISETLGAEVGWDGSLRKITIKSDTKSIVLHEGNSTIEVNGTRYQIETAPEIKNGTTFVPVRFISEHLGATVKYNSGDQSIDIVK